MAGFPHPEWWPTYGNGLHKPVTHIALDVYRQAKLKKRPKKFMQKVRCLLYALDHWHDNNAEWSQVCRRQVELAVQASGVKIPPRS